MKSLFAEAEAARQAVTEAEQRAEALGRIRIEGEAIHHHGLKCTQARDLQERLNRRTAEAERLREALRRVYMRGASCTCIEGEPCRCGFACADIAGEVLGEDETSSLTRKGLEDQLQGISDRASGGKS